MRILKEPMVHFVVLGVAMFLVQAWRQNGKPIDATGREKRIDVSATAITRLKDSWTRQFHRPPDVDDLRRLVEAHIKEEVLCREALAMGLDRDDTIVRRRMAQKMEFLTQDIATAVAPDEAALSHYFGQNAARYTKPPRISFRHVYFNQEKRGAKLDADANEALTVLAQPGASDETLGDAYLQGFEFSDQSGQDIISVFGSEFAASLLKAPLDAWSGPIESSYGLHLVRVTHRSEPQPLEFAGVRETVLRDFLDERRRAANEEVLARLKQTYEVVIDEAALKAATVDAVRTAQTTP